MVGFINSEFILSVWVERMVVVKRMFIEVEYLDRWD